MVSFHFEYRVRWLVSNAIDLKCFEPLDKRMLSIINPSWPRKKFVTQVESGGSTLLTENIWQARGELF